MSDQTPTPAPDPSAKVTALEQQVADAAAKLAQVQAELSKARADDPNHPQVPVPYDGHAPVVMINGQQVPILDDRRNPDGHRQGPDVAAAADPDSGFFTVSPGDNGESVGAPVGGTSAATPFWAASLLLIRQFAERLAHVAGPEQHWRRV